VFLLNRVEGERPPIVAATAMNVPAAPAAGLRTSSQPPITMALRPRRRCAPAADLPDRPRGVRGFRSFGLVLA